MVSALLSSVVMLASRMMSPKEHRTSINLENHPLVFSHNNLTRRALFPICFTSTSTYKSISHSYSTIQNTGGGEKKRSPFSLLLSCAEAPTDLHDPQWWVIYCLTYYLYSTLETLVLCYSAGSPHPPFSLVHPGGFLSPPSALVCSPWHQWELQPCPSTIKWRSRRNQKSRAQSRLSSIGSTTDQNVLFQHQKALNSEKLILWRNLPWQINRQVSM